MTTSSLSRVTRVFAVFLVAACTSRPPQAGDTQRSSTTPPAPPPPTEAPRDTIQASGDVELTLDKNSYAVGDQVRLTIRSRTSDQLGFNPCGRSLERREGQRWVKYSEPTRICTMELWLLEPNATRSAATTLPASISRGTYRLVLLLSRQGTAPSNAPPNWGTVRAESASFTVD